MKGNWGLFTNHHVVTLYCHNNKERERSMMTSPFHNRTHSVISYCIKSITVHENPFHKAIAACTNLIFSHPVFTVCSLLKQLLLSFVVSCNESLSHLLPLHPAVSLLLCFYAPCDTEKQGYQIWSHSCNHED